MASVERVDMPPHGSLGTATACNFDIQSTGSGVEVHGSQPTLATTSSFAMLSSGTGVLEVGGKGVVASTSATAGILATIALSMAGLVVDERMAAFGTSLPFLRLMDVTLMLLQEISHDLLALPLPLHVMASLAEDR